MAELERLDQRIEGANAQFMLGVAAVIVALRRKGLTPEVRAAVPPEVLPHVEAAVGGDREALKVLAAWIERHGDRTTIQ